MIILYFKSGGGDIQRLPDLEGLLRCSGTLGVAWESQGALGQWPRPAPVASSPGRGPSVRVGCRLISTRDSLRLKCCQASSTWCPVMIPSGVGWGGRWEGSSRGRGHMEVCGWFMLRFARKQHNTVKQMSSNRFFFLENLEGAGGEGGGRGDLDGEHM